MTLILPKYLESGRDERISIASRVPSRVQSAGTLRQKGVNVYRCPVCRKEFRHDDAYEPACTGWNETTDDHPMAVMQLVRVEPRKLMW